MEKARSKTSSRLKMKSLMKFGLIALTFVVSSVSFASHFRSGSLTATRLSETATTVIYRLNYSSSWRLGASGGNPTFSVTGGNTTSITIPTTNVNDPSGGWLNSVGSANITLNKTTVLTRIEWISCCKISTIANNHDANWDVYAIINTGAPGSTPVSTLPAIINMPINAPAATYTLPASDPDAGSTLTYGTPFFTGALAGQIEPSGFSINSTTGLMTLNTVGKTLGQQYNALVTVKDNDGNFILIDFLINMVGPSTPPVFDYAITPTNGFVYNVMVGQNLTFPISASDMDAGSLVSLSISGLPSYITTANFTNNPLPATANPSHTTFSWTPTGAQIGSTIILNIIATDNVGVQATTSVTIRVVAEPAPVFVSPTPSEGLITAIETGSLYSQSVVASSTLASNVSIAFATGIPSGAVLLPSVPTIGANPGQTQINWNPSPSDFGMHTLSFQATIAAFPTIFSSRSFQLVVNTLSEFTSVPVTSVLVGQFYSYNVTVSDLNIPYGDIVDITGTGIPSWLTLVSTGNGTAILFGTPTISDIGIHAISLEAEDLYHHSNSTEVTQDFDIQVIEPAPIAICNNAVVSLDQDGNGSVLATQVDGGSYSLVGISSMTVFPNTFNCGNIGDNSVILTVVNSFGSQATCQANVTVIGVVPTCSIALSKSDNTFTGGAMTDLFLGYGASTLTLTSTAVGADPFTYSWTGMNLLTTVGNAVVFAPKSTGLYTLTCTVTNSYGCQTTCSVVICVKDIRVPNQTGKVYLCHVPSGNPTNTQTLSISTSAVATHLTGHAGDKLGACDMNCGQNKSLEGGDMYSETTSHGDVDLIVYPNPSTGTFNFTLESESPEAVGIKIYDLTGSVIFHKTDLTANEIVTLGDEFSVGLFMAEVTQGEFTKIVKLTKVH